MDRKTILAIAVALVMIASGFALLAMTPAAQQSASSNNGALSTPQAVNHPALTAPTSSQYSVASKDLNRVMSQASASGLPMKYLYLPNFHSAVPVKGGHISPGYSASPAPMGIGDYGLNNSSGSMKTYNYTTDSFNATINLAQLSDFNMLSDSPQGVTFQLNAVLNNVALFGNASYSMWTQNVIFYSARTHQITFIDNIWNFSSPAVAWSSNAVNYSSGTVYPYSGAHIAIGPTFTLTYPWVVHLYLNTSVTDRESTVWFNYSMPHATNATGHTGAFSNTYDMVEFNSTYGNNTYVAPHPHFFVSGTNLTPTGFIPYDAEIMVGGPGGGSTATIYNINGSMSLQFYNNTSHSYNNVRAAYDIGSETGETSTGVDVSYAGHTAFLNPGPSMVYGLWNNQPSQTTYTVTTTNTVSPFVFITNNVTQFNMGVTNWAPMPSSTMHYRLPSSTYVFQALSNYHDPTMGQLSTTTTISLVKDKAMGIYTPIIIMNNAELAAQAVSGAGTATSPYLINAQGSINTLFGQLNDYLFPAFPGVLIMNTTKNVVLNDTYMPVQYTGFSALIINFYNSVYGAYGISMPLSNELSTQIYNTSNLTVVNGTFETWFSFQQAGFVLAALGIWNSTNIQVLNNTFVSMGDSLLVYNAPTQPGNVTIVGNEFYGYSFLSGLGPMFESSLASFENGFYQNGIDMYSGGNMVYSNVFLTQSPANDFGYNFYMGTLTANYTDGWNNTTTGNLWWNYDGVGAYNNSGMIGFGYDYHPLLIPGATQMTIYPLNGITLAGFSYDGFDIAPSSSGSVTVYQAFPQPFEYAYAVLGPGNTITDIVIGAASPSPNMGVAGGAMAPVYLLTFSETGLASGNAWSVSVNGMTLSGTTSTLSTWAFAGKYNYAAAAGTGFSGTVDYGMVSVTNAPVTVSVSLSSITLTFEETGLASGTTWTVNVNGHNYSSNTSTISVSVVAGSNTFTVAKVSGYQSSVSNGTLNVNGNATVSVVFSSPPSSPSSTGTIIAAAAASLLGGLVIGIVVSRIFLSGKGGA